MTSNSNEPNQGYFSNTVTMVGRLDGVASDITVIKFCRQGDATTPIPPAFGFDSGSGLQFPSPSALMLRARAWTNMLLFPLTVTLMKNGQPALRGDGITPVQVVIPPGSIDQIFDTEDGAFYDVNDTFDVRLSCEHGGGGGNAALVGVAILAVPSGRRYGDMTLTLSGRHNADAGEVTTFARPGDVTSQESISNTPFAPSFPAPRAVVLRARAWINLLPVPLRVVLLRNGQAARRPDGSEVEVVIPASSTAQVMNINDVVSYPDSGDTYDVKLVSVAGGGGNFALMAVAITAQDFSGP